jgi:hypothetical protein
MEGGTRDLGIIKCPIDGVSASDGGGICICRAFSFTYPWGPPAPSLASDGGGIEEGRRDK